jgi:hypothetical protein
VTRALVVAAVLTSSLALATSSGARSTSFPSPALVRRLADRALVVRPVRPDDRPRITLKRAIAIVHAKKPYLVYALRLTDTDWTSHGRPVVDDRLVWLFIFPHVRFPIFGYCRHHCFYYADAATAIDANSGRWLFSVSV